MTKYELVFLLNEETGLTKIKELIESLSIKILKEEKLGKKNLLYPIQKNRSAFFYDWQISVNKDKIQELRKKLNFNEQVIRYLLLVNPDKH